MTNSQQISSIAREPDSINDPQELEGASNFCREYKSSKNRGRTIGEPQSENCLNIYHCTNGMLRDQEKWRSFRDKAWTSPEYKPLRSYIGRTLHQFKLDGIYYINDVIVEADSITTRKIEEGEKITNLPGWLRKVAHNVIRNFSRKELRQKRIISKLKSRANALHYDEANYCEDFAERQIDKLLKNFYGLTELEQRILTLRHLQGLSWKEVSSQLVADGLEMSNPGLVDRVRKQGHRAKEKLGIDLVQDNK